MKIRDVFNQMANNDVLTKNQNQQLRKKLIDAIEEQIKLFEITDLFIKVFTSIILMHFVSVAVIIGIGSIDFLIVCISILFDVFFFSSFEYMHKFAFIEFNRHMERIKSYTLFIY